MQREGESSMPTVKITAFSKDKLPSPIRLKGWKDDWSKAAGGDWTGPTPDPHHDNAVTFDVTDLTVRVVENTVDPTIEDYNKTHTGKDEITADVT
jgi:hypothetical protein